jgi:hypothetical protein
MRSLRRVGWLSVLSVLFAAGCTTAPPAGTPTPPAAEVLPGDSRVFAYGYTVDEVLRNPTVGDKVRDLFWIDWMPASEGGGQLSQGARAYFAGNAPLRMVRIGGVDYIALTGCQPSACNTQRVLVLVRDDGSQLLARLDDGGFAHYYGYGSEDVTRYTAPLIVDSGLRALRRGGSPYPGMS